MIIKSIVIEMEPSNPDDELQRDHAKRIVFANGRWVADGPLFNKYFTACSQVWDLLRRTTGQH